MRCFYVSPIYLILQITNSHSVPGPHCLHLKYDSRLAVVAFSSLVRILGECSTGLSPPPVLCVVVFLAQIS